MTDDEKDRALCEAHCNSAADEYFNARPQLDSSVNRRIFYAGHRKAWIERDEVLGLHTRIAALEAKLDICKRYAEGELHDPVWLAIDYGGTDYEKDPAVQAVAQALTVAQAVPDVASEFNRAIDFAVEQGSEAASFLRSWREGDVSEWPEFPQLLSAPVPAAPQPRDDGMPASSDERHLRRLLAARVAMPNTYFDDGEAHGAEHGIQIDFMREPVAEIDAKLRALNVARLAVAAPQPAPVEQTDARDAARWRYIAWHIGVAWNEQGFTSLVRIVSDKHREMLGDMVDRMMAGDWPEAAPQPAQQYDDEGDALTIAYLHGHGKGKDSVQPVLSEKDALLRQSLEALEGFVCITNDSQGVAGYHLNGDTAEWDEFDEIDAASSTIEAIRNHLGVKT